ncbi:thioredoxin family protein [Roseivirga thermotolerans]|uniref:Thioredoxin domain-containing protein n=1 Tax=Roseivirga thermotolerans TaxID=1758176 RepID=A0ABQ3IAE8_9BACT|nr:thioredoxin family protein [Roseivirga thermotolerans]GHE75594.1 hypothetical protein GCM10011340_35590 [Roseivirga thermotolerans]
MQKLILSTLFTFLLTPAFSQINWYKDYELAKSQAKAQGKLLMIDFWAIWCGPCKNMDSKLWSSEEMLKMADKFIAYKADIDFEVSLAMKYQVKGIPRVIFITPDEKIVWDRTGFASSDEFLTSFAHLPTDLNALFSAIEANEKEESQLSYLRLGEAYSQVAREIESEQVANNFFKLSNEHFRKAEKGDDATISQLAELNQILNVALGGNTKRALKKLEKVDNSESEITRDFIAYVRAYCYKCNGQNDEFQREKSQIKDEKLVAELDKNN